MYPALQIADFLIDGLLTEPCGGSRQKCDLDKLRDTVGNLYMINSVEMIKFPLQRIWSLGVLQRSAIGQGPRRGRGWGGFSLPLPPPPPLFCKNKNKLVVIKD